MQISQQQYNAVIEGLRTQLELQRELCREKGAAMAELAGRATALAEALSESKRNYDAEVARLGNVIQDRNARLELVKATAEQEDPPILDIMDAGWTETYAAVRLLRKERDFFAAEDRKLRAARRRPSWQGGFPRRKRYAKK
jgi:hypothetical protein